MNNTSPAPLIGIFGGSFDPIHNGHLQMAQIAKQQCHLQQVYFVPCKVAAYAKEKTPQVSDQHRLAMLTLALSDYEDFAIDDCELTRPAPSYTIDTLAHFKQQYPHATLCFILGFDAFCTLPKWQRFADIFKLAHLIILPRVSDSDLAYHNPHQAQALRELLAQRKCKNPSVLQTSPAGAIYLLKAPRQNISSTSQREQLHCKYGEALAIPENVRDYIFCNHLYQEGDN